MKILKNSKIICEEADLMLEKGDRIKVLKEFNDVIHPLLDSLRGEIRKHEIMVNNKRYISIKDLNDIIDELGRE